MYDRARPRPRLSDRAGVSLCKGYNTIDSMVEARTFCAWPCLLRQVGTVLGSPYDCVVARLAYANPGSRQTRYQSRTDCRIISLGRSRV